VERNNQVIKKLLADLEEVQVQNGTHRKDVNWTELTGQLDAIINSHSSRIGKPTPYELAFGMPLIAKGSITLAYSATFLLLGVIQCLAPLLLADDQLPSVYFFGVTRQNLI
jgi:hypothetical protein